jgi:starch-binding outer membrane protein, SusD/RagB family
MKQYKSLVFILASILFFSSCKKQLDLKPTDTFSDANAFLTIADIQLGTNEVYVRFGGANLSDIYVSALVSDEAKLGFDNAGQGALTYRYQYASDNTAGGDVIGAFGAYYAVIDQINRVLPFIPKVTGTSAEEPRRNILKAQLLAMRGISHFGLLKSYCKNYDPADPRGIPILLTSDPLGKPKRNTMGEVMAQIEKDLSDAKALLPVETVASFRDTTMNKINIAAYQARIALFKNDYASAITYSTEVINSAVKPLVTGSNFTGIWTDANSNETLFRIRYATSTAVGALWTTTGGQYYVAPSDKLTATYTATDIRKNAYTGVNGSNSFVNKYFTSSRGGRVVDLKACRIAEMYLIRAEAYAKRSSPDLLLGAADLNALRAQRIVPYTNQSFATAADLVTAVLAEKYKELFLEGFRLWDLKRNNLPVQRNASDANSAWQTLDANNYRFVMPIPKSELLLNPNMTQNDGY